jgi:hypothetical protein
MDFGDWATWAGAIGTSGALIVASRTFRAQINQQRRQQARLVHGWVVLPNGEQSTDVKATVSNTSGQPVYDVVVKVLDPNYRLTNSLPFGTVTPGESPVIFGGIAHLPGEWHSYVTFTDSEGTRWRRTTSGTLRLVRTSSVYRWRLWWQERKQR